MTPEEKIVLKWRIFGLIQWVKKAEWWNWTAEEAQKKITEKAKEKYPNESKEYCEHLALCVMKSLVER